MDEQQQYQQPGSDPNAQGNNAQADHANQGDPNRQQAELTTGAGNQRQLTDEELKRNQEAARQQGAGAAYDPNAENAARDANALKQRDPAYDPNNPNKSAAQHTGLLDRMEHGVEHATGMEAWQRHERRRQAFNDAKAGPVGQAINDVNAFLNAMHDCDAETPEEMLADSDVQQAAVRARNGLKVFTGDTPVTFSKPTSDAHLNVGSGGAVTGNTPANRERAAAVRELHGDPVPKTAQEQADEEEAVPVGAVTKVPQPDAHVR
jgi:hypothetical protein